MISSPLGPNYEESITTLNDDIRRAVDGTVPPLFVDYTNKRILIGTNTASGTASLQVPVSSLFDTTVTARNVTATAFNTSSFVGTTVTAANVTATGIDASGDITASAFYGDGSKLSGVITSILSRTRQVFTATSTTTATYNTPANCKQLFIRMVGGGAGGNGSGGSPGNAMDGGNSTFGSSFLTCNGGKTGGQAGGTAIGGDVNIQGGSGSGVSVNPGTAQVGQPGGCSAFGGFGYGIAGSGGNGASPNSGSGGAGGGGTSTIQAAASGSSGGYIEKIVNNPNATYSYAVGAGGAGGTAGTGGFAGGAGGSGIIIVDEFY